MVSPEAVRVAALLCGTMLVLAGTGAAVFAHAATEGMAIVGLGASAITWVLRAPGDVRLTKQERESLRPGKP